MDGANSAEFDPETPFPVIDLLPEQKEVDDMGGTMRLGADPVKLHDGTRARAAYDEPVIYQRHRHRYEVNNLLRRRLEDHGLVFSGTSPDDRLVEVIELPDHPFFVASQYHPEFKSRPNRPEPMFREFVARRARTRARARRRRSRHESTASCEDRSGADGRRREARGAGRARQLVTPSRGGSPTPGADRLGETFVRLCEIPSPSGQRGACRRLRARGAARRSAST